MAFCPRGKKTRFTSYNQGVKLLIIQGVSKWRIPNSERGREGPSGARKMLRKKFAVPEEDISTLILFNT
jgi:hypothetical protein